MCQELKRKEGPKHYARISTKRRQSLVDLVIEKGYSIGRAAVRLKIKLSTAKMIVKKYKEHGRFFEKKFVSRIRPKTSAQPTQNIQTTHKAEIEQTPNVVVKKEEEDEEEDRVPPKINSLVLGNENQKPNPLLFWSSMAGNGFQPYSGFIVPMSPPWCFPSIF